MEFFEIDLESAFVAATCDICGGGYVMEQQADHERSTRHKNALKYLKERAKLDRQKKKAEKKAKKVEG